MNRVEKDMNRVEKDRAALCSNNSRAVTKRCEGTESMNGIKIKFIFNTKEGFDKEKFEAAIGTIVSGNHYRLVDCWCIFEKTVYVPDFPVFYYVNECILEIACEQDSDAETIYQTVKELLLCNSEEEHSLFTIISIQYEPVCIQKELQNNGDFKSIKVFVTGVAGQLGHDVMNRLYECGYQAIGTDIAAEYSGIQDGSPVTKMPYVPLDIRVDKNVKNIISEIRPDVVIHCAAWNAVDQAEDKGNTDVVQRTNAVGTQSIAEVCAQIGSKMIYISTDYVFEGTGEEPWDADARSSKALNVYGQTKLDGERAVSQILEKYFIVRTSWAYGINGSNFVKIMLDIGKKYGAVRVVNDQIGTPTYTKDLANLLADMITTDKYGYYNATNAGGYISWYEFACEIFKQAGLPAKVIPVSSDEYDVNRAARPYNSRLDKSKLVKNGFKELPDWKDALHRYLIELGQI